MKALRILLLLPLVSCTSIYGNRQTGSFAYHSLGGDTKGLAMTPDGVTAEAITNAPAFQELSKTVRTGLYLAAAKAVVNSLSGAWQSTKNASTAAQTAQTQAVEATKQSAIQATAATEQAKILATPTIAP